MITIEKAKKEDIWSDVFNIISKYEICAWQTREYVLKCNAIMATGRIMTIISSLGGQSFPESPEGGVT